MNHQNTSVLLDKSLWRALDREQLQALSSKYTILCPIILFTEIVRHKEDKFNKFNTLLNLKNIFLVFHWSELVKMDLLTDESSKPIPFANANAMQSIRESSEEDLLEFKEVSGENIEMLIESEEFYRNQESFINPLKAVWLRLVKNIDNLSDEEWVSKAKEVVREHQAYYPEIERILKKIETGGFPQEGKALLQASIETLFDTYNADSLESACQIATRTFNHDPSDINAAHDKLLRLCTVFGPILTEEERTQIFNRFLKEDRPPISRFAPYALGAAIWNYTIQLYLRENPENAAPRNVLRDAVYLLYTGYKEIIFASGDKWHRKFINEVPLFEGCRESFTFVDLTTKATIQEGLSKIL